MEEWTMKQRSEEMSINGSVERWRKVGALWAEWLGALRARRRRLFLMALFLVVAVCLGRMSVIGATMPFGLAFFGAVLVFSPRWAVGALACMVVGALSSHSVGDVLLLLVGAFFVWRAYIGWGARQPFVRVPLFCFGAQLAVGWSYALAIEPSLYACLLVMASAVLTMLSASLFLCGLRVFFRKDDAVLSVRQVQDGFLAMAAMLALAVAGIGDLMWLSFGLCMVAGSLLALVLISVTELGIALASCIGLGFAIGIADGNVSMTMAEYAMAGLAGCALKGRGKVGAAGGFFAGLGGMLVCFDPYGEMWYMMAEASVGCGAFLLIPKRYLTELGNYLADVAVVERAEDKLTQAREKVTAMTTLFRHMASVWQKKGGRLTEVDCEAQTASILSAVEEVACSRCDKRKACWEDDFFAVSQEVLSLADGKGEPAFDKRCPSAKEIASSLERVMREGEQTRYWRAQCGMQQSLLAEQMHSVGAIFEQMAEELRPKQEASKEKADKIARRLSMWGCRAEELTVGAVGEVSRLEIVCPSCGGCRMCEVKLLPFLTRVLASPLRMSVICGAQNGMRRCRLFFVTQERVQLLTGMVGVGRLADEPSGDTCEMITLPQGRTAILVSDGMGCGKEASDDSAEAITLLKELLVAGFDAQTAVKTVNSLLLLRKDRERFPTADVLIINKYTGEADFIKLGTPPAFIKRQSEVIVIKDDTLPLGALAEVGSEPIRIPLENDDYIVMMTDGAIDIPEERLPSGHTKESWVRSRIRLFSGNSPQALAEHLLEMAMRLSGRTLRDDMTVIAVKIKTVSRIG